MHVEVEHALDFLDWWRPGGPWVLTAINDRRALVTRTFDTATAVRPWLEEHERSNIYFHVNPTRGRLDRKARAADIAALAWLHVDVDPQPGRPLGEERARILALLQDSHSGMPPPSAIVFSGGGYQAYWRLKEPLPIRTPSDAEQAKLYNLQVELLLGGDSCHNVDRIMRLPGTVNWPNEKKRKRGQLPVLAHVISRNDVAYDLSQFTAAPKVQGPGDSHGSETGVNITGNVARGVDIDSLPVPDRVKVVIVQGHDPDQPLAGADQSRSAWLFYVVCQLVRAKVDDDTIYAIITDPDYRISDSVLDKGNSHQVARYAARQIKKAKEHAIAPELAEMNDTYALVESMGGRCRIAKETWNPALDRREVEFLLIDGFKQRWSNRYVQVTVGKDANGNDKMKAVPLGEWWLRHPERRTYSSVIFYPGKDFPGTLNLWRGFAFDALPGDCSLFLNHLRKVLCRGNQEHYDYLIRWMAYGVQNPAQPGHVAVVLRGKQGTGKGTFARHYGALWGVHFKHITRADHVTGQFNSVLADAAFVFADECFRTDRQHVAALKTLITESTLRVEAKGVDNLDMRNCVKLCLATNEQWAVHAELDDRRFFILEVGDDHRKDSNYFAAIEQQMLAGGYHALLHYLLTMDLAGFDVRQAPATEELRRQQRHSMTGPEAYWLACLEDGRLLPSHDAWTGEVLTDEFTDRYLAHYSPTRATVHQAKTRLGIFLRRLLGSRFGKSRLRGHVVEWEDSRGRRHRQPSPVVWTFPSLEECRAAWDKEFGAENWPDVPDSDTMDECDPL